MPRYTVKLAGDAKEQQITADEFSLSPEGHLKFFVRNGESARIAAVFSRGQWQFLMEQN